MKNFIRNFIKKTVKETVQDSTRELLQEILKEMQERITMSIQTPIGFCVECKKAIGLNKGHQVWQNYVFCSNECQKKFEKIANDLWEKNHPEEEKPE